MQKLLVISAVLIGCVILSNSPVSAQDTLGACNGLQRPNIDCACVAKRMDDFKSSIQSSKLKSLLDARYANAIGLKSDIDAASTSFMSDPSQAISAQMAFDKLGGLPENIEDFERGCAANVEQRFKLDQIKEGSPAESFVESRVKSVGENQRRSSICLANELSGYLSDAEFLAYQLSYSYYQGDHQNDDAASRAKKMGVSKAQYEQLEKSARAKFQKSNERNSNYCNAITYAEDFSPARIQADQSQEASRFATVEPSSAPTQPAPQGDQAKAERLMQTSCKQQGNSPRHCQCVMKDFDQKAVNRSPRPGVTLAWVAMRNGSKIDSNELMQLMQNTNRQDQQDAAQLFMTTLDVGDNCAEKEAANITLAADPRERMMKTCMADVEDGSICNCLVDKMQSKLNDDDFELVVDIRDAESQGAEDPLEAVAEDRGLTREGAWYK